MMKKLLAPILGLLAVMAFADPALAQFINPATDVPGNLTNATGGSGSFKQVLITIVNFALGFLGIIAVVMIIYGGYMYVISGGDEGQAGKGKQIIIYAIIGIVIILLSFAIVNTVLGAATGQAPV